MDEKNKKSGHDLLKSLASPEFYNYYIKEVAPYINEIETHRKTCLAITIVLGLLFSAVFIVWCFSFYHIYMIDKNDYGFIINGVVSLAVIGSLLYTTWLFPIKKFRSIAKQKFLSRLLNFWGNFKYYEYKPSFYNFISYGGVKSNDKDGNGPFNVSLLKRLLMIGPFNIITLDDNVRGVYNGLNIELQEMHLKYENKSSNGKRRTVTTTFKGLLMIADMKKNFKCRTVLVPDDGILNTFQKPLSGLQKVTLEDPRFESRFEVFSDSQIEARYLLTTAFMERILRSSRFNPDSRIKCEFVDGKMYMAFSSNKDWFELPLLTNAQKFQNYQRILCELASLLSVIDTLKLEQNIGL